MTNNPSRKPRILSSDILAVDVNTSLRDNPDLQGLVQKYGLKPGKNAINREQYEAIYSAIWSHEVRNKPSGPAATVLMTMNQLLGNSMDIRFIGVVGTNKKRQAVLKDNGITLTPDDLAQGREFHVPVTFVIDDGKGGCIKATYPGNISEFLKPEVITDDMVSGVDTVLVMGSLWQRVDKAFPDKLMALAEKHGKEIWLTLPTNAKFATENSGFIQQKIAHADLVFANDEELRNAYCTQDAEEAFRKLQKTLAESGKPGQAAFITREEKGAVVLTADNRIDVPAIPAKHIVNVAGAGDTSFAAFASGYRRGMPNEASARMAMQLAHVKLGHESPRLEENALDVLRRASPELARELESRAPAPTSPQRPVTSTSMFL